jgi:hypothetical protein
MRTIVDLVEHVIDVCVTGPATKQTCPEYPCYMVALVSDDWAATYELSLN